VPCLQLAGQNTLLRHAVGWQNQSPSVLKIAIPPSGPQGPSVHSQKDCPIPAPPQLHFSPIVPANNNVFHQKTGKRDLKWPKEWLSLRFFIREPIYFNPLTWRTA